MKILVFIFVMQNPHPQKMKRGVREKREGDERDVKGRKKDAWR